MFLRVSNVSAPKSVYWFYLLFPFADIKLPVYYYSLEMFDHFCLQYQYIKNSFCTFEHKTLSLFHRFIGIEKIKY